MGLQTTGGAGAPFDDATAIAKGSADPTKQLRFEVDGFTAGQTRVVTFPDANITVARTDAGQSFTGVQLFGDVVGALNGLRLNISGVKTSAYTVATGDYTVLGNASGGAFQITLPTAVGRVGQVYIVKNVGASNTVTVGTTSSQTIDGSTTYALSAQYATVMIQSDNANWVILAKF